MASAHLDHEHEIEVAMRYTGQIVCRRELEGNGRIHVAVELDPTSVERVAVTGFGSVSSDSESKFYEAVSHKQPDSRRLLATAPCYRKCHPKLYTELPIIGQARFEYDTSELFT